MLFSVQTPAAGGTAFAQFAAAWCYDGNGYILNDTGTSLDVRIGATGSVITLADGTTLPIKLVHSMAELYVRRTDQSVTQVTVEAQIGTGSAGGGTTAEVGVIASQSAAATTAAHNADPAAHGSGVYTVAQLAAFTNANRPTGCVFCSDCLVPEGVGSPVVWNGAVWVCTYCGLIATTSPLTYFREARKRGCDIDTESQFSAFLRPNRFGGAFSVNSGASSGVDSGYDVGTLLYLVGATGYSTVIPNNFAIQSTTRFSSGVRPAETALYYATDVYVSAMSDETDEFAVVFGLLDVTQVATIGASFIGGIYDRGNSVGIGNTGKSANLFAVTRAASTNTVTELGVALGVGRANVRRVEVLKVGASVEMYIDQVLVATHTTNIPSANLQPRTLVLKTAGSAVRYAGVYREFFAARF